MGPWLIPLVGIAIGVVVNLLRDPNKWYGQMICNQCDYDWESRRSTPPARCPKCSSKDISSING